MAAQSRSSCADKGPAQMGLLTVEPYESSAMQGATLMIGNLFAGASSMACV